MTHPHSQIPFFAPRESSPPKAVSHGVVYTRPWVIELMLDQAGVISGADLALRTMVEPAAGDGAFAAALAARLAQSCRVHDRDIATCTASIIAFELSADAAARSRGAIVQRLISEHVDPGTATTLAKSWVRTGDFLLNAPSLPKADLIIGNPPYVRLEEIDPETVSTYRRLYPTMVGRADLYVAFYEAALRKLKTGGRCAFICADRWMLNQYGAALRRLVTSDFAVESIIEMHTVGAFEDEVDAYPAVTVLRRGTQGAAVVARAEAGIEATPTTELISYLSAVQAGEHVPRLGSLRAARINGWFEGEAPWPAYSPERLALLKYLEAQFHPLESSATGSKVGIGVATGADGVFITRDAEIVEPERLLPLAMAVDTRSGHLIWSGHYLVNPWQADGLTSLAKSPRLAQYFEEHGERLRSRHVGKKSPHAWYRTIDRVDLALTARPKLLIADIKDRLNPVLDTGQYYPHHNLYWVTSASWDMEVLGGLLLSDVAQFFVECYGIRMRGGYLRFQAQYLRRIRVPRPQDLTPGQAKALRTAYQTRDRGAATAVALEIYKIAGIPQEED